MEAAVLSGDVPWWVDADEGARRDLVESIGEWLHRRLMRQKECCHRCLRGEVWVRDALLSEAERPSALPYGLCWLDALIERPQELDVNFRDLTGRWRSDSLASGAAWFESVLDVGPAPRSAGVPLSRRLSRLTQALLDREYRGCDAATLAAAVTSLLVFADPAAVNDHRPARRAVSEVLRYYDLTSPPGLLDVIRVGRDRPTPAPPRSHFDPAPLLAHLARIPLGADLHIHLNGTGAAELWAEHAARLGHPITAEEFRLSPGAHPWSAFSRCNVKHDLIKTDPLFLADLLRWNVDEARGQRVSYLELSVGPYLFLSDKLWSVAQTEARRAEERGVLLRFLVGLDRARGSTGPTMQLTMTPHGSSLAPDARRSWLDLVELAHTEEVLGGIPPHVRESEQRPLWEALDRRGVLSHPLVVGVDYVGLEWTDSIRKQMPDFDWLELTRELSLGVRLHAGEGVEAPRELLDVIGLGDALLPQARLGHGVGFGAHLAHHEFPTSAEVIRWMDRIAGRGLVIEVNLTSNEMLFGVRPEGHPLRGFLDRGWPVVISTDDPGIFGTSLRKEFELAIRAGLVRTSAEIDAIVLNSVRHSFLGGRERESLLAGLESELRRASGV